MRIPDLDWPVDLFSDVATSRTAPAKLMFWDGNVAIVDWRGRS